MREGVATFVRMRRVVPRVTLEPSELLALRRRAGLNIFHAAARLGITPEYLSRCERGGATASPELVGYMRAIYGADRG